MSEQAETLSFIPVTGLPEVQPGAELGHVIKEGLDRLDIDLVTGDVVVVASKIVAKAEERVVNLEEVQPSRRARALAQVVHRDARELEVMLREGGNFLGAAPAARLYHTTGGNLFGRRGPEVEKALERMPTLLFFEHNGELWTEAGIDQSNVPGGEQTISLVPADSFASARRLADELTSLTGQRIGVIISDSEIRLLRRGSLDIGLGWWGVQEVRGDFGKADRYGLAKFGGVDHIVDGLCAACGLLMGQTDESIPAVLVRGLTTRHLELAADIEKVDEVDSANRGPRSRRRRTGMRTSMLIGWGFMQLIWTRIKWRLIMANPLFM